MVGCGELFVLLWAKYFYEEERMRFLGSIEGKADIKGRVFLPAVFRKVLQASGEENLVLRKDIFAPCLVLYPESVWNQHVDALRQRLSDWRADHRQVFRQFVSDVELLTLDGNGRLLIPKRYLRMAEIDQDVRFLGVDNTIEIWRKSDEDSSFMEPEAFGAMVEQLMGDSSSEE